MGMRIIKYISESTRNSFDPPIPKGGLPKEEYPLKVIMEKEESYVAKPITNENDYSVWLHNLSVLYHHEYIDYLEDIKLHLSKKDDEASVFKLNALNFLMNGMTAYCNRLRLKIWEYPLSLDKCLSTIYLMSYKEHLGITSNVISETIKKLEEDPTMDFSDAYLSSLPKETSSNELEGFITEVFEEFPKKVEEYRGGKKGIASMFIGYVMRKKKGMNPVEVKDKIVEMLEREK